MTLVGDKVEILSFYPLEFETSQGKWSKVERNSTTALLRLKKYHLKHPLKWLHLLKSKDFRGGGGWKESSNWYKGMVVHLGLVLSCVCEWDGWPTILLLKAHKWHFSGLWYKKLAFIWKTAIQILPLAQLWTLLPKYLAHTVLCRTFKLLLIWQKSEPSWTWSVAASSRSSKWFILLRTYVSSLFFTPYLRRSFFFLQ